MAQFRAHSSPLSALSFDPSGTLLVTASVYGHNLNVFRLTPPSSVSGVSAAGADGNTSYVHLYKLYRGVTNAVSAVGSSLLSAVCSARYIRSKNQLLYLCLCDRSSKTSVSVLTASGLPLVRHGEPTICLPSPLLGVSLGPRRTQLYLLMGSLGLP